MQKIAHALELWQLATKDRQIPKGWPTIREFEVSAPELELRFLDFAGHDQVKVILVAGARENTDMLCDDVGELVELANVPHFAGSEETEPRLIARQDHRLQPLDLATLPKKRILCTLESGRDLGGVRRARERQVSLDQEHVV